MGQQMHVSSISSMASILLHAEHDLPGVRRQGGRRRVYCSISPGAMIRFFPWNTRVPLM